MIGWEEMIFTASRTVTLDDEASAAQGLDACFHELLYARSFRPTKGGEFGPDGTVVSFSKGKDKLELDMIIAFTVWFSVRYVTSLERVAVLDHEPGSSFKICITACQENIIDGYYRVSCRRTGTTVALDWSKVQSLNGALMGMLSGKDKYKAVNEESANGTADLLAEYVENGAKLNQKDESLRPEPTVRN